MFMLTIATSIMDFKKLAQVQSPKTPVPHPKRMVLDVMALDNILGNMAYPQSNN